MKFLIKKRWFGVPVGLIEIDMPDVRISVRVNVEADLDPDHLKNEGLEK